MNKPCEQIQGTLARAGFEVVMLEPSIPGGGGVRPDLLVWASDVTGNLVPWAVIEMKNGSTAPPHPAAVLQQLAPARDLLGTQEHYLVMNGVDWYRADAGLQRLDKVDGPASPVYGGEGRFMDSDMLTSLLQDQLRRAADASRGRLTPNEYIRLVPEVAGQLTQLSTLSGDGLPIDSQTLWTSRHRASVAFLRRSVEAFGEWGSHPTVARTVAQLAGSKLTGALVDPFCGLGSYLWNSIEYATQHGTGLSEVVGVDLNDSTADAARLIASDAPIATNIIAGDGYTTELPQAGCVVSGPPLGMRLPERWQLLDGTLTGDGELAAIDRCIRLLEPGGRAILHLSRGFTFKQIGETYRQYLASHLRVAALIGLPPGALIGTGIRSVLLVLDDAAPSPTFVAQLGEDWEEQLAPDGAALHAALDHLDGAST